MTYVWVALGGALGSVARYWCVGAATRLFGDTFPWGTLIVNVAGSFVIGVVLALSSAEGRFVIPPEVRLFVAVGVCGGFTTFSAFSAQTLYLMRASEWMPALANIGGSVILCLVAVSLGHVVGTLASR